MKLCLLAVFLILLGGVLYAAPTDLSDFEHQLSLLVNQQRSAHQLPPLEEDAGLAFISRLHSQNMLAYGFLGHKDQVGDEVKDRKRKYYPEVSFTTIGENLARIKNREKVFSPEEIVQGWMNTPSNRANILNESYTHQGIGIVISGKYLLATQDLAGRQNTVQMRVPEFERRIWELTNQERIANNLPPLEYDKGLADLSQRHSMNMLNYRFFDHKDQLRDDLLRRKNKFYPQLIAASLGENLARLCDQEEVFSPEEVVQGWMDSPAQRDNILNKDFTHLGVGVVVHGSILLATQDFARKLIVVEIDIHDFEQQIWKLTNEKRSEYKLPPLEYDEGLADISRRQSQNMLDYGFFGHKDQRGDTVSDRKRKYYPELLVSSVGENLARFFNSQKAFTAQEIVDGWMNSPPHRENILSEGFTHLGVGVVIHGSVLLATQNFATPLVKLKSPLPLRLNYSQEYSLDFTYLSPKEQSGLYCTLRFPDRNYKYYIDKNRYILGSQPIDIAWLDKQNLSVKLKFPVGTGKYRLNFGFNNTYYEEGIVLRVK